MVSPQDIKRWIEENMPGAEAVVDGDGHHFEALIVSAEFVGQPRVRRHQMVYRALGERMKSEIHALSMRTLTPDEHQREPS